jgi:hypothetical protein
MFYRERRGRDLIPLDDLNFSMVFTAGLTA